MTTRGNHGWTCQSRRRASPLLGAVASGALVAAWLVAAGCSSTPRWGGPAAVWPAAGPAPRAAALGFASYALPTAPAEEAATAGPAVDAPTAAPQEAAAAGRAAESGGRRSRTPPGRSDDPWSVRAGLGFTLDPSLLLLAAEGDYFVTESFALGPLVQLGVDARRVIFAPTWNLQYAFHLGEVSEEWKGLQPFVQAGAGFAYIHKERRGDNEDDTGLLFNLGFGLEYYFTDQLAVGNNVLFNIMPDKVVDENFFFSWQFATLRFRF